jgi:hypothetical protein
VAQGEGPEFKPQYCKKIKIKINKCCQSELSYAAGRNDVKWYSHCRKRFGSSPKPYRVTYNPAIPFLHTSQRTENKYLMQIPA